MSEHPRPHPSPPVRTAAIIGAGAAGLATARALREVGISAMVFEAGAELGGIWRHDPRSESDPLGQSGPRIHSSLYDSLRTNLPCDLMGFVDVPFRGDSGDDRRFPGHARVLRYLEAFADRFDLREQIHWAAKVIAAMPLMEAPALRWPRWQLLVECADATVPKILTVDALAVCAGHYAEPRIPPLPGDATTTIARAHSHNYRRPDRYRDRTVAVWGGSSSAIDIVLEVAAVARKVVWCAHAVFPTGSAPAHIAARVERRADIAALLPDGRMQLTDGSITPPVDDLLYCTGYLYRYPFLDPQLLHVEDNVVAPLYRDLLHARFDSLGLVGVPFRVVPFPLFAVQASYLARLWQGQFTAPTIEERLAAIGAEHIRLADSGVQRRHWHQRRIDCYDYLDALADDSGAPRVPDWYRQLTSAFLAHSAAHPGKVRELDFSPTFGSLGPEVADPPHPQPEPRP